MKSASAALTLVLALTPLLFIPAWFSPRFGLAMTSEFLMGTVSVIIWSAILNLALAQGAAWLRRYKSKASPSIQESQSSWAKPWIAPALLIWSAVLAFLGIFSLYQMPGVLALIRWSVLGSFLVFKPLEALALLALFTILFLSAWRAIPSRLGCYVLVASICLNLAGQLSLVMRDPAAAANPILVLLLSAANTLRVSP
jgi:K+ transporter